MGQALDFLLETDDDSQAWKTFASNLRNCPLEEARKGYEILFERFPCSGNYVVEYCEIEKKHGNKDRVLEVVVDSFSSIDIETVSSLLRKYRSLEVLLPVLQGTVLGGKSGKRNPSGVSQGRSD